MKKTVQKPNKMQLTLETVRAMRLAETRGAMEGISVGTCTACRETYNPTCCGCYTSCV
jgi:hypothetical protein